MAEVHTFQPSNGTNGADTDKTKSANSGECDADASCASAVRSIHAHHVRNAYKGIWCDTHRVKQLHHCLYEPWREWIESCCDDFAKDLVKKHASCIVGLPSASVSSSLSSPHLLQAGSAFSKRLELIRSLMLAPPMQSQSNGGGGSDTNSAPSASGGQQASNTTANVAPSLPPSTISFCGETLSTEGNLSLTDEVFMLSLASFIIAAPPIALGERLLRHKEGGGAAFSPSSSVPAASDDFPLTHESVPFVSIEGGGLHSSIPSRLSSSPPPTTSSSPSSSSVSVSVRSVVPCVRFTGSSVLWAECGFRLVPFGYAAMLAFLETVEGLVQLMAEGVGGGRRWGGGAGKEEACRKRARSPPIPPNSDGKEGEDGACLRRGDHRSCSGEEDDDDDNDVDDDKSCCQHDDSEQRVGSPRLLEQRDRFLTACCKFLAFIRSARHALVLDSDGDPIDPFSPFGLGSGGESAHSFCRCGGRGKCFPFPPPAASASPQQRSSASPLYSCVPVRQPILFQSMHFAPLRPSLASDEGRYAFETIIDVTDGICCQSLLPSPIASLFSSSSSSSSLPPPCLFHHQLLPKSFFCGPFAPQCCVGSFIGFAMVIKALQENWRGMSRGRAERQTHTQQAPTVTKKKGGPPKKVEGKGTIVSASKGLLSPPSLNGPVIILGMGGNVAANLIAEQLLAPYFHHDADADANNAPTFSSPFLAANPRFSLHIVEMEPSVMATCGLNGLLPGYEGLGEGEEGLIEVDGDGDDGPTSLQSTRFVVRRTLQRTMWMLKNAKLNAEEGTCAADEDASPSPSSPFAMWRRAVRERVYYHVGVDATTTDLERMVHQAIRKRRQKEQQQQGEKGEATACGSLGVSNLFLTTTPSLNSPFIFFDCFDPVANSISSATESLILRFKQWLCPKSGMLLVNSHFSWNGDGERGDEDREGDGAVAQATGQGEAPDVGFTTACPPIVVGGEGAAKALLPFLKAFSSPIQPPACAASSSPPQASSPRLLPSSSSSLPTSSPLPFCAPPYAVQVWQFGKWAQYGIAAFNQPLCGDGDDAGTGDGDADDKVTSPLDPSSISSPLSSSLAPAAFKLGDYEQCLTALMQNETWDRLVCGSYQQGGGEEGGEAATAHKSLQRQQQRTKRRRREVVDVMRFRDVQRTVTVGLFPKEGCAAVKQQTAVEEGSICRDEGKDCTKKAAEDDDTATFYASILQPPTATTIPLPSPLIAGPSLAEVAAKASGGGGKRGRKKKVASPSSSPQPPASSSASLPTTATTSSHPQRSDMLNRFNDPTVFKFGLWMGYGS